MIVLETPVGEKPSRSDPVPQPTTAGNAPSRIMHCPADLPLA